MDCPSIWDVPEPTHPPPTTPLASFNNSANAYWDNSVNVAAAVPIRGVLISDGPAAAGTRAAVGSLTGNANVNGHQEDHDWGDDSDDGGYDERLRTTVASTTTTTTELPNATTATEALSTSTLAMVVPAAAPTIATGVAATTANSVVKKLDTAVMSAGHRLQPSRKRKCGRTTTDPTTTATTQDSSASNVDTTSRRDFELLAVG